MAARIVLLLALAYVLSTTTFVDAEIFTALSHVERLINIEMELSDALEDYLSEQESRLKKLRSFHEDVKKAMGRAISNREDYIGHPVNTYLMIQRLVKEWTQHVKSIEQEGDAEGKLRQFVRLLVRIKPCQGRKPLIHRSPSKYEKCNSMELMLPTGIDSTSGT